MTRCVQCDKHEAILLRVWGAPRPEWITVCSWCSVECLFAWMSHYDLLSVDSAVRAEVVEGIQLYKFLRG